MPRALTRLLPLLLSVAALVASPAVGARERPPAVVNVETVVERDEPQICLTFSDRLYRWMLPVYRELVVVTPARGTSLSVRDRVLCVEGLRHRSHYNIEIKSGLPTAFGATWGDETISMDIPGRAPSLTFRGGPSLSRATPGGLSLRSVNTERARLRVSRVDDPDQVEREYFKRLARGGGERDAGDRTIAGAREVWNGEIPADGERDRPISTVVPFDAVPGTLGPGIYIARAEAASESGPVEASRWFVVSDLGLNTLAGSDGLWIFARRMGSAEPAAGVRARVLSAAGRELASVVTGSDGLAKVGVEALGGTGEKRPRTVFARTDGGEFAFVDLTSVGPDGGEGPSPFARDDRVSANLHLTRGLFRSGETVDVAALPRDAKGDLARDIGDPVFRLRRPDGFEVDRVIAPDAGAGARQARFELSRYAQSGRWTIEATAGSDNRVIGSTGFVVDDSPPPRFDFALSADRAEVGADGVVTLNVAAARALDIPAASLPGEISAAIRPAATAFPKYPDFHFGLEREAPEPRRVDAAGFTTDVGGRASVKLELGGLPDTPDAMEVAVRATVADLGGRRLERELVLPMARRPLSIGVRPRFAVDSLPEGAAAGFDVIALDERGEPAKRADLTFDLIEEEPGYEWFEADGKWDYRVSVKDRRVTGGTLAITDGKPGAIEETVGPGRYRLEVYDAESGAAGGVRFTSGWWVGSTETIKADRVEVAVMLPAYKAGETAQVFVQPPRRALVLIGVVDRSVRRIMTREIGPEGAFLDIPVDPSWTGGVWVTATAFDKPEPGHPARSRRAIGESWLAVTPVDRGLDVRIAAPDHVESHRAVTVEVKVEGAAPGTPTFVELAAVDETLSRAAGFSPFDPQAALFGPRDRAVEERDVFGRVASPETRSDTPRPTETTRAFVPPRGRAPALHSGVLPVGADGKATIPLAIPEYDGRLRLTATAWTATRVGRGEAWLRVSDFARVDVRAPSSLIVGDETEATAEIENTGTETAEFRVSARGEGVVSVARGGEPLTITLEPGRRAPLRIAVAARSVGSGRVVVEVGTAGGRVLSRARALNVESAEPALSRRSAMTLTREGVVVSPMPELTAGFGAGEVFVALSAGAGNALDVPGILARWRNTPILGAESAAARLSGLSVAGRIGIDLGLWTEIGLTRERRLALDALLSHQRVDGAFGAFSPRDEADLRLTAAAIEAMRRASAAGVAAPEPSFRAAVEAARRALDNTWIAPGELADRSRALAVLAAAGAIDADRARHFRETWYDALPDDVSRARTLAALVALGDEGARDGFAKLQPGGRDAALVAAIAAEAGAPRDVVLATTAKSTIDPDTASETERASVLTAARALTLGAPNVKVNVGDKLHERAGAVFVRLPEPGTSVTAAVVGDQPLPATVSAIGAPVPRVGPEGAGFSLVRRVFDMRGEAVDSTTTTRGASVVVLIEGRMEETRERARVLVVDIPPAGFEVETARLDDGSPLGGLDWLGALSAPRKQRAREARFETVLELSRAAPTFRLAYIARAETPGRYQVPGAKLVDLGGAAPLVTVGRSVVTITE